MSTPFSIKAVSAAAEANSAARGHAARAAAGRTAGQLERCLITHWIHCYHRQISKVGKNHHHLGTSYGISHLKPQFWSRGRKIKPVYKMKQVKENEKHKLLKYRGTKIKHSPWEPTRKWLFFSSYLCFWHYGLAQVSLAPALQPKHKPATAISTRQVLHLNIFLLRSLTGTLIHLITPRTTLYTQNFFPFSSLVS